MNVPNPEFAQRLGAHFANVIPHAGALGFEFLRIEGLQVIARMPVRREFLGDIERGIVHTGIVTSLIDSTCGIAVLARIGRPEPVATLDLRVDYLRPTLLGPDLVCRAECYRLSEQIAFVRATVWQHDDAEPVATSLATFARSGNERGRFL